jgi:hypothetical protein
MKVTICLLFACLAAAQRVTKLSDTECNRQLNAFNQRHPELTAQDSSSATTNAAGVFLTQAAIRKSVTASLEDDSVFVSVFRGLASDTQTVLTEKVVALVYYGTIFGNISLDSLAEQGAVEPVLTTFTNRSRPLYFARSGNRYTVRDGTNRTYTVTDTKEIACNVRFLVVDGFLLPATTATQMPRVAASKTEALDIFEDGVVGVLPPASASESAAGASNSNRKVLDDLMTAPTPGPVAAAVLAQIAAAAPS